MPKDPSQKLSIGNWDEKTLSKKVRKAPYQNFASKIRSLCLASFRQELDLAVVIPNFLVHVKFFSSI
ncbi:hypothetical protein SLEP1_g55717 [Rubroshorea leprosula]|uniref:Uncharacterized protein n=1 Tax=Rubroshorea leprosula TaxID=152421 RepID=A0AAV5MH75_9ROSI|nr:hypothetical protein SLEP1_g55717 [Rubroshorea leprosula]